MTFTILTPYRLFFITQSDTLYALMKDGRVLKISKVPYFSALSSDFKLLTGISFDGENTHIFSQEFEFNTGKPIEILSLFGYFYYPALSTSRKKMALIEADLLKPRPEGELCIYQKKIKRWYKQVSFDAKMKSPFFLKKDDELFFIDCQNNLICFNEKVEPSLLKAAENVQIYAVSKTQTKLAYFNGNQIVIYSLLEHKEIAFLTASYVTALGFSDTENEIYYARSYENRYGIYSISIKDNKPTLVVQTDEPVILLH